MVSMNAAAGAASPEVHSAAVPAPICRRHCQKYSAIGCGPLSVQNLVDGLADCLKGVGLSHADAGTQHSGFLHPFGFRIAGGNDCFLVGMDVNDAAIGFQAIDTRIHYHIQQQDVHLLFADELHGGFIAGNALCYVSEFSEHGKRQRALLGHVVHGQNPFAAALFDIFAGGAVHGSHCFIEMTLRYAVAV